MPEIGPCGPVGPDAPLSDVEKKEFTKRMAVEGFTAAAVQAACECAFNEGIPVLFLPAGRYAFDKEVPVLGGLTVPGEGSGTVCQTEGKSPKTIEWYIGFLNGFRKFLSFKGFPLDLDQINRDHIRAYIAYLQNEAVNSHCSRPLSPATIQGPVRTLKAFFSWAVREEYIDSNPLLGIC